MNILATTTALSILALLLLSVGTVSAVCNENANNNVGTDDELTKLTDGQELQDTTASTTFNDTGNTNTNTNTNEDFDKCTDNGNIAPCFDDELGGVIYYCDDERAQAPGAFCMPSPEEWKNFLPSCDSINYSASCVADGEIVWTCDDPEYNTKKYDTTCVEPNQNSFSNLTDFSSN